jgi:hypothetical protein
MANIPVSPPLAGPLIIPEPMDDSASRAHDNRPIICTAVLKPTRRQKGKVLRDKHCDNDLTTDLQRDRGLCGDCYNREMGRRKREAEKAKRLQLEAEDKVFQDVLKGAAELKRIREEETPFLTHTMKKVKMTNKLDEAAKQFRDFNDLARSEAAKSAERLPSLAAFFEHHHHNSLYQQQYRASGN